MEKFLKARYIVNLKDLEKDLSQTINDLLWRHHFLWKKNKFY